MMEYRKAGIGKYKIGLRTYKTAMAVFFCLFLSFILSTNGALFASIAAVICMKETHKDTLKAGIDRMVGTIIGGVLGYIYLTLAGLASFSVEWLSKIVIPVFIIICIYLCNLLKMKDASSICSIVFLVVALAHFDGTQIEVLSYVGVRVLATLIGIAIAMLINKYIAPFHREDHQENDLNDSPPSVP
jgi:uncharacterized membrane protein YgaE (UPF0421/DUF939 family)